MQHLYQQFDHALILCKSRADVEALHVEYLGKKGYLSDLFRQFKTVPQEEKKSYGEKVNALKEYIEKALAQKEEQIFEEEICQSMRNEAVDVSLPSRRILEGSLHPIMQMIDQMVGILKDLGFSIQVGPQVDTDYYNFEVLNFPKDHPAKDMQDTFYIEPGVLLRTHTSTVQGRIMEKSVPPIRIASPGRVFRNEDVSARSHSFFHQVEALYIDTDVSMQDLFWTLKQFVRRLYARDDIDLRFRPSYFPFVEPGIEVDVTCLLCGGLGCMVCKGAGWLEICGAGMVHPQVLRNVGIDPEKYQGYAWGLGVERLVMIQKAIKDIRLFSENDLRFLQQFHAV